MCSQPFPLVCLPPSPALPPFDLLHRRVLGLGALPNHPRSLPSSKSYTRAGLQGIVNCSCSANLHKSILNQLSGLRRVRAGRLAGWKRTGYAQVPDEMRRDATQRDATQRNATQRDARRGDAMRCDATYRTTTYTQGVLNGTSRYPRRRYACAIMPTHHDLRVRVCTRSNKVTPDGVSNRRGGEKVPRSDNGVSRDRGTRSASAKEGTWNFNGA